MRLAGATWPEVDDAGRESARVLVLPVGSLEQHGPHLPLDTDATTSTAVAEALVAARPRAALAPTIPFGASGEHADFPGTISIGTDRLRDLLVEIVRDATRRFAAVLAINGHGGNGPALRAARAVCDAEGTTLVVHHTGLPGMDGHAGRSETSLLLHLAPERVRLDLTEPGNTTDLKELLPALRADGVRAVSPNGVLGDPTGASAEEGADLFTRLVDAAAARFDSLVADRLPGVIPAEYRSLPAAVITPVPRRDDHPRSSATHPAAR